MTTKKEKAQAKKRLLCLITDCLLELLRPLPRELRRDLDSCSQCSPVGVSVSPSVCLKSRVFPAICTALSVFSTLRGLLLFTYYTPRILRPLWSFISLSLDILLNLQLENGPACEMRCRRGRSRSSWSGRRGKSHGTTAWWENRLG